jgi:hypothetical protein
MRARGRPGLAPSGEERVTKNLTSVVSNVATVREHEKVRHRAMERSMTIKWGGRAGMRGFMSLCSIEVFVERSVPIRSDEPRRGKTIQSNPIRIN